MQLMLQVPNNRRAMEKFAAASLLKNPEQGKAAPAHAVVTATGPNLILANSAGVPQPAMPPPNPPNGAITPPVALDSFGNPIIFVPGAGLRIDSAWDGTVQYRKGRIVSQSGKLYRSLTSVSGAPTSNTSAWEEVPSTSSSATEFVVRSPENRPFFASAGNDGDFRTPDDNVYSFE